MFKKNKGQPILKQAIELTQQLRNEVVKFKAKMENSQAFSEGENSPEKIQQNTF